jgi:hypothetical protein
MVRSIMIVEMAGRPAEHLSTALEKHIGILRDVDDIEVHSIKLSEPKEIETESKVLGDKMWTAFAEADFECESFARLSETMFDFMPSSVEVIEPSKVTLSMKDATDLLNNISGRMHRYDEVAKIAGARMQQMTAQLQGAQKVLMDKDAEIVKLQKKPVARSTKPKVKKSVKKSKKVSKK